MKVIIVGDPHVQVSNLEESNILLDKVFEAAKTEGVEKIVFLGDMFHNHDVVRSQVLSFWIRKLKASPFPVTIVTGNHDMPGSKELEGVVSALDALDEIKGVTVVGSPVMTLNGVGFCPYRHSKDAFLLDVAALAAKGAKTIFCHQTFDTAQFENGFYAPEGVDPKSLPPGVKMISGHIHAEQKIVGPGFDIWYPGTPRWLTASDANSKKAFWLYDTDSGETKRFDSSEFIVPLIRLEISENDEIPDLTKRNTDRTSIQLTGSALWVKEIKKKLPDGIKITSKFTDQKKRSSKTVTHQNIFDFLSTYKTTLVTQDQLKSYMEKSFA